MARALANHDFQENHFVQINPYLNFRGDCREAFELYARVLGGKIEMMQTHGDSPMKDQTAPEWRDKILHAHLTVGGEAIMGSDAPPQHYEKPQGLWVSLNVGKPAEAKRIYEALGENAREVRMPLQKTVWGTFAMFIDRFGTPWAVNADQSD